MCHPGGREVHVHVLCADRGWHPRERRRSLPETDRDREERPSKCGLRCGLPLAGRGLRAAAGSDGAGCGWVARRSSISSRGTKVHPGWGVYAPSLGDGAHCLRPLLGRHRRAGRRSARLARRGHCGRSGRRQDLRDAVGCGLGALVLPHAHHGRAPRRELGVHAPITRDVPRELRLPEWDVHPRHRGVLRAPVPEATIDEDRHAGGPKDDVRSRPNGRVHPRVHPVAQPSRV